MAGVGQDLMGVLVVFLTKCSQRDFARHGQGERSIFEGRYVCVYVRMGGVLCVFFFSGTVDFCMFGSGWILTDVVVLQRPDSQQHHHDDVNLSQSSCIAVRDREVLAVVLVVVVLVMVVDMVSIRMSTKKKRRRKPDPTVEN